MRLYEQSIECPGRRSGLGGASANRAYYFASSRGVSGKSWAKVPGRDPRPEQERPRFRGLWIAGAGFEPATSGL
jgi:hypothetical protein